MRDAQVIPMALSAAETQRAYRQRQRAGVRCIRVEVDAVVEMALCDRNFLARKDADDERAVAAALQAAIATLVTPLAEPDDNFRS
jgi:hypothetical protein